MKKVVKIVVLFIISFVIFCSLQQNSVAYGATYYWQDGRYGCWQTTTDPNSVPIGLNNGSYVGHVFTSLPGATYYWRSSRYNCWQTTTDPNSVPVGLNDGSCVGHVFTSLPGATYYWRSSRYNCWQTTTDPNSVPIGLNDDSCIGHVFTSIPGATYYWQDGRYGCWQTTTNPNSVPIGLSNGSYAGHVFTVFGAPPNINLTSPRVGSTTMSITGTISDYSGDKNYLKYAIDNSNYSSASYVPLTTGKSGNDGNADYITANGTAISFASADISLPSLSNGTHTVYVWGLDQWGNITSAHSSSITVDQTPPTVSAPTISEITSTSMQVTASASDSGVGLNAAPYLFNRNGADIDTWRAAALTNTGLTPNTQYTYTVRARDVYGNISGYSAAASAYTIASNPSGITKTASTGTSLTFDIANNTSNGTIPQFKIEVKLKGAGAGGTAAGTSDWNSATANRTVEGLAIGTAYEVWATTRNGNSVANTPVKYIDNIITKVAPTISITAPAAGQIRSAINGYNTLILSGAVNDTDTGDTVTVYYRIDGDSGNTGTGLPGVTPNGSAKTFADTAVSVASCTEGNHTLYVWAADNWGAKTAEAGIPFKMDKTGPTPSGCPTLTVNSSSKITVHSPGGTDPAVNGITSGLGTNPILFNRNGTDINPWRVDDLSDTGLTGSTQYTYKFKLRDAVGNESTYSTAASATTLTETSGVTLNQNTMSLIAGTATGTLVATVTPSNATNKNITWSSNNTAVASVNNGVVTPIAVGTAAITVTTEAGNFTDTCNVTVAANPPPTLIKATATGATLTIEYSDTLNTASIPDINSYTVKINQTNTTPTTIAINNKIVTLNLSTSVKVGDTVTLT